MVRSFSFSGWWLGLAFEPVEVVLEREREREREIYNILCCGYIILLC